MAMAVPEFPTPTADVAAKASAIALLVLDIDGTLCGASNEIAPPTLEAIAAVQDRGVQVAIATGRMYRSALRFQKTIGATLPLVAYQGALIHCPEADRTHLDLRIDRQVALDLLDLYEQPQWRDRLSVHAYDGDRLYVRELTPGSRRYAERTRVQPEVIGDLRPLLDREPSVTKLLALSPNPDEIAELWPQVEAQFRDRPVYLTRSNAWFIEAAHPNAHKGHGVRYLAENVLGLTADQVMFVGDNFNDFEAITYAGLGVAMGDAPDPVKAIAQWVAPDVEACGVAHAIATLLL